SARERHRDGGDPGVAEEAVARHPVGVIAPGAVAALLETLACFFALLLLLLAERLRPRRRDRVGVDAEPQPRQRLAARACQPRAAGLEKLGLARVLDLGRALELLRIDGLDPSRVLAHLAPDGRDRHVEGVAEAAGAR